MTRVILGALGGVAAFAASVLVPIILDKWSDYCYRISDSEDWGFVLAMSPFAAFAGAILAWLTS